LPYLNGIDVASYQESAALQTIDSDFFIIKASEGVGWGDPALASNVAEARLSGKPVGFYHYARPLATPENTAKAEAVSFLERVKPYLLPGDLLALDWEAENQDRTDWALEFLHMVKEATGAIPLLYASQSVINTNDWSAVEKEFPLWIAAYGFNDQTVGFKPPTSGMTIPWTAGIAMWQYTSKGRLNNYGGDLDFNIWYGSRDDWIEVGARTRLEEPAPNPPIVVPPEPVIVVPAEPANTDAGVLERFFRWLVELFLKSGK
jgi:GH25 family lysozyme M1 (1,4-beta-N-acetylmuramidase)